MVKTKVIHRGNGQVLGVKQRGKLIAPKVTKLDLSYGELPPGSGFEKVAGLDPQKVPWKLADESVEEALCAFRLNRIPGAQRMAWMAELWRVLVPGGKATIIVPYWSSPRSIQDPESQWPPICDQSFSYFTKAFRDANKEDARLLPSGAYCDFDVTGGYQFDPDTAGKSDEVRPFWVKHYLNAVSDLHMTLTKRPK
jgi:hypothetical protein